MKKIIVSRHPGAVAFVRAECQDMIDAAVMAAVTPYDVEGADVVGNLPMALAALCGRYRAIEFSGPPPRGAEFSEADMRDAGARIVGYVVTPITESMA